MKLSLFALQSRLLSLLMLVLSFASCSLKAPVDPSLSPQSPMEKGNLKAPVTIIFYSDFTCGHCKTASETMDELLSEYPEDILLVYKPVAYDTLAMYAGRAALAAGAQGKFWEMQDLIFQNQRILHPSIFNQFATKLGLNTDQFAEDYKSPAFDNIVKYNTNQLTRLGSQGTPTFIINGVMVMGARPLYEFEEVVEQLKENAPSPTSQP